MAQLRVNSRKTVLSAVPADHHLFHSFVRRPSSAKGETELRFIGNDPWDLRFFILQKGRHAGGITVHSVQKHTFSYGIAISPAFRRKGIARDALLLLFEEMRSRGFTLCCVCIRKDNSASLCLHRRLGFAKVCQDPETIKMERRISP